MPQWSQWFDYKGGVDFKDGIFGQVLFKSDIVDHHIGDIIKTLAISSAFDIAKDAAVSWISSIEFFSSLSETLENKNETINNIAEKIAEMKLNQQPTIEIRAGMRGNIFINKDMVLPIYRSSGY